MRPARVAFGLYVASLLAGCGGSQPPIGAPGVMPQSPAITAHAERGGSWMLPKAKSGDDLLYASGGCGGVCVLSYPDGKLVGMLSVSGELGGNCSDAAGNVFITDDYQVLEYAHGGTSPIATLNVPGYRARACAIDSSTGNLAVVFSTSGADIAIYPGAAGAPALYETAMIVPFYCGYDDSGNLFISGLAGQAPGLNELAHGSSRIFSLSISGQLGPQGQVQWDGKYITYQGRDTPDNTISRLKISGSVATVVGTTRLKGDIRNTFQSWIHDSRLIVPYSIRGLQVSRIGVWRYPKGGNPVLKYGNFGQGKFAKFMGVTVSVAPRR